MNYIDYLIVAGFFLTMIALGFYYKKSQVAQDYFLGGKRFGWFSLAMSAMATQLSAISFLSAPAFVGMRKGGGMQWLTYEFGVPLAMLVLIGVLAPALYRSGVVSIYAFLEGRLGRSSRLLLGAVFLVNRSFATGVTIYAVCLALSWILHLSFVVTMCSLGLVTVLYSLEGGMKAVVYSEVAQMVIKILGILTIVALGFSQIGGWDAFLASVDRTRLQVIDFSNLGFSGNEYGFLPMLIGGVFLYCSYYGTDQTQAQRILSARDETTVRKLLLFNGLVRFPITLSYCVGGLVLGAFAHKNVEFAQAIPATRPDLMIPVFMTHYLPHGIIGILVVAIIAAGMSTFSSNLNSMSAVAMEDFVTPNFSWARNNYVLCSKLLTLLAGVITMVQAMAVGGVAATVIEAINKISSLFFGPIFAMFVMAIWPRRPSAGAANIGVLAGVAANLICWLFFKNIFWFWWNALGAITAWSATLLFSFVLPRTQLMPGEGTGPDTAASQTKPRTFPLWALLLVLWFAIIVSFSLIFPHLF